MPDVNGPRAAPPPHETLAGYVERVTYRNPESGFHALRVRARGHRGEVAVVAKAPEINPGEWIEARGAWIVHPKFGRQFEATEVRQAPPDTLEGIEKYLASGMIRGIGPEYARRLVRKFGRSVFDVIERQSARLLEVEGIGPTRRERIREAWSRQRAVRDIMTFLFSHGVSPARAFRIHQAYGDRAIETIRLDPYRLARDIRGIGFAGADRIAQRLGVPRDSMLRARAGLTHVLAELTEEGHCAWPADGLVERAAATLELEPDRLRAALADELAEGRLVRREAPGGVPLIYLPWLDAAERDLAARLGRLRAGAHPLPTGAAAPLMAWIERHLNLHLAPAQRDALAMALTAKVSVITGGPGVGKTTLIRALILAARQHRLRIALCAPTGRAAKRLSESAGAPASTIHRLLEVDPAGGFRHGPERPLPADWVVVDESSMLDVALADHLVRAVASHAAMVFVGDADQLPPVGPGMVLRDLIDSGIVPVARLTHIFRQAARSHIVENAHRIHAGQMPEIPQVPPAEKTDFYFVEAEEPADVLDRLVRLVRDRIPKRFGFDPFDDVQVLTPMQRGELGARNLNAVLQQALNPHGAGPERFGVLFRVGDKVMQVENDYDRDVFNGDIGRVVEIREEEGEVRVRFDERVVAYSFGELDGLTPAYAITVHKSQGSEYPCVAMPLHTQHFVMLQRNLLYTAVTRGRRLVVLIGSPRALAIAVRRAEVADRVTLLKEWLRHGPPEERAPLDRD